MQRVMMCSDLSQFDPKWRAERAGAQEGTEDMEGQVRGSGKEARRQKCWTRV